MTPPPRRTRTSCCCCSVNPRVLSPRERPSDLAVGRTTRRFARVSTSAVMRSATRAQTADVDPGRRIFGSAVRRDSGSGRFNLDSVNPRTRKAQDRSRIADDTVPGEWFGVFAAMSDTGNKSSGIKIRKQKSSEDHAIFDSAKGIYWFYNDVRFFLLFSTVVD